jgi:hypothetical protein
MKLRVDVIEGDWADFDGPYGCRFSWSLGELIRSGDFDPSGGPARWHEVGRVGSKRLFEVPVADDAVSGMTVGDLKNVCLAEARRLGAARPAPPPAGPLEPWDERIVVGVWLADAATDKRLPDDRSVGDLELADGDSLVLCVEHPARGAYSLAAPPNPDELLRWLQLAENSTAPSRGARLWGVLLYTDADVELATYVRTHFDDLNVLSGPATRVFVMERRAHWPTARKYWRRHLEPELFRVMSAMRWLRWTPHDAQGAYEIASLLGLGPEQLPCLVFFHSPQGPLYEGEKIVFPIEEMTTEYFRMLFGGIEKALRPVLRGASSGGAEAERLRRERYGPAADPYSDPFDLLVPTVPYDTQECAPAATALRNLLAPGREADATAFAAVREAEQAIKAALRPVPDRAAGLTVSNSHVVVISGTAGAQVSENFYFQGKNTTFINRPTDTVIQDFQNSHAAAPGTEALTRLLRLVLESRDLGDADRAEAAGAIHELARLSADGEGGGEVAGDGVGGGADAGDAGADEAASASGASAAARTRLERLRELLSASADIATPALAILASITPFFSG